MKTLKNKIIIFLILLTLMILCFYTKSMAALVTTTATFGEKGTKCTEHANCMVYKVYNISDTSYKRACSYEKRSRR